MVEERVTETETPTGDTHTTHTVVTDDRRGGGGTWLIVLALIVLLAVGIWFFTQQTEAEIVESNAVTEAANEVGDAAGAVENAVEDVATTGE